MNRAAVFYYTRRGEETARRVAEVLRATYEVGLFAPKGADRNVVEEQFCKADALIFVGACGIAVRSVAPLLKSKTTDPAVIVTDERGGYVISLLSGHIGGANALTRRIAERIGGAPVITTATDVNRRFAADEWAARHGLVIHSMEAAKRFAAAILEDNLPVRCDFPVSGELPVGLFAGEVGACGLSISCGIVEPFDMTLRLIPKILHLGLGCKRGTGAAKIRAAVACALEKAKLDPQAIACVASIDVKRDEAGLLKFCSAQNLQARFYTAGELLRVEGGFTASAFVQSTVGVDNVCERAAVLSAGQGARLILRKTCMDGVTVAVAQEKWSACFE